MALAWSKKSLASVNFPRASPKKAFHKLNDSLTRFNIYFLPNHPIAVPTKYIKAVRLAFLGKAFSIPLTDVFFMTPFQQNVHRATLKIHLGKPNLRLARIPIRFIQSLQSHTASPYLQPSAYH